MCVCQVPHNIPDKLDLILSFLEIANLFLNPSSIVLPLRPPIPQPLNKPPQKRTRLTSSQILHTIPIHLHNKLTQSPKLFQNQATVIAMDLLV